MRRLWPWCILVPVTTALTAISVAGVMERYEEFRLAWAWDLAWVNQWLWAITEGDGTLTICPANFYGTEGPSVWQVTHLTPVRLLLVPLYRLAPDPRTLLAVQCVVIWWTVPAAYTLARSEAPGAPRGLALSAALLVPLTPLVWPLTQNCYYALQLGLPFMLWAIQGYRARHRGLTVAAVGMLLLCREEYGPFLASLALLPPRDPEDIGRTHLWRLSAFTMGVAWLLIVFLGYQSRFVSRSAPEYYLNGVFGPRLPPGESAAIAWDYLTVGLGAWSLLALAAPRFAALAVPWLWSLSGGRWALRQIATWTWNNVRWTTLVVGPALAAGVVGYMRIGTWLLRRRRGAWLVAGLWLASAAGSSVALREVVDRMGRIPRPIPAEEVPAIWRWIDRVGPEDGVVTAYELSASLSGRRLAYGTVMRADPPRGYPAFIPTEIRWLFLWRNQIDPNLLAPQGFEAVHDGPAVVVYRRRGG